MKALFCLIAATFFGLAHAWAPRMTGEEIDRYTPLTAEELSQLVKAGTSVVHTTAEAHNVRRWKNGSDGEFVASTSDGEIYGGRPNIWKTGHGKWWLRGNHYCVLIVWRTKDEGDVGQEQWCRAVYPINGTYYLAPVNKSPAQLKSFYGTAEFSN